MDLWDRDDIDLLGPATIEIAGDRGTMRFIAVEADLDLLLNISKNRWLVESLRDSLLW